MTLLARIGRCRALWGLGLLVLGMVGALYGWPLPPELRDLKAHRGLQLLDRHGEPLRLLRPEEAASFEWLPLSEFPDDLQAAIQLAEDRRFAYHPGVDPLAIGRAAQSNLRHRRVVSGASTITQQLVRTARREAPRSAGTKLAEALWALRLERRYSKDQLLEAYLNRVPLGGPTVGFGEGAWTYFGKPSRALSLGEAALLCVLVRAPGGFDLESPEGLAEVLHFRRLLLQRMVEAGAVRADEAERAADEDVEFRPEAPPFAAPHFCDLVLERFPEARGSLRTSLDLPLQQAIEGLASARLQLLANKRAGNLAVVVAEVETGRIRALVGSGSYFRSHDGQWNAADSLRQPGSTLKPFTYALLLEKAASPGLLLPDLPLLEDQSIRSYLPDNYDRRYHGPVRARVALASSYNVPAVKALERVGVSSLLALLRGCGLELPERPQHYGLGLTLGDGSCSLLELVEAYRVLARGGVWGPLELLEDSVPDAARERRVLEARSAYLVTDILDDPYARTPAFGRDSALEPPFPCAVKTGTSKGYRDNWTVGYTPTHVVGVWVGNSDGSPMREVSGISGAGPLFADVVALLGDGGDFPVPDGLEKRTSCLLSGATAGPECIQTGPEWWRSDRSAQPCAVCRLDENGKRTYAWDPLYWSWAEERGLPLWADAKPTEGESGETAVGPADEAQAPALRITFPQDGDVLLFDPDLRARAQTLRLQAAGGRGSLRWQIHTETDGGATQRTVHQGLDRRIWWPLEPGRHRLEVSDDDGRTASIRLEVRGDPRDARS